MPGVSMKRSKIVDAALTLCCEAKARHQAQASVCCMLQSDQLLIIGEPFSIDIVAIR